MALESAIRFFAQTALSQCSALSRVMCKDCALSLASAFWKKKLRSAMGRVSHLLARSIRGGLASACCRSPCPPFFLSNQHGCKAIALHLLPSSPFHTSNERERLAKWQKWERGVFERKTKKLNRGHEFLRLVCSGLQNLSS
jgi:hypothetical protein